MDPKTTTDDEDDENDGDDDDDDKTTTADPATGLLTLNSNDFSGRDYSSSPSRFDGGDILERLNEMSEQADRIDSILEQRLTQSSSSYNDSTLGGQRGTYGRSVSPGSWSLEQQARNQNRGEMMEADSDTEVD